MKEAANKAPINKPDIAKRIAEKQVDWSESLVLQSIDIMLEQMVCSMTQGRHIELRGFGSFTTKHYEPRKARNPKTGEILQVDDRKKPRFKAGRILRENVDNLKNKKIV